MPDERKTRFWRDDSAEIAFLDCTNHRFPKHYHDEYVLGVNITGGESIWLDGKECDADLDDITVYNPGEIQSSSPLAERWTFVSIYFDDDYYKSRFCADTPARFSKPVIRSGEFARRMRRGCLAGLSGDLADAEVHELILEICDGLFTHAARIESGEPKDDSVIAKAVDMLLADLAKPPKFDDLAGELALSPVQFVRLFKKCRGLPPMAWLRVKKLHMVRDELAVGAKPAFLASKYGFADQPHMTRHFKRVFGYTPKYFQSAVK